MDFGGIIKTEWRWQVLSAYRKANERYSAKDDAIKVSEVNCGANSRTRVERFINRAIDTQLERDNGRQRRSSNRIICRWSIVSEQGGVVLETERNLKMAARKSRGGKIYDKTRTATEIIGTGLHSPLEQTPVNQFRDEWMSDAGNSAISSKFRKFATRRKR